MADDRKQRSYQTFRPGKTREDYMPVDQRPRVIAAKKRAERMKKL